MVKESHIKSNKGKCHCVLGDKGIPLIQNCGFKKLLGMRTDSKPNFRDSVKSLCKNFIAKFF